MVWRWLLTLGVICCFSGIGPVTLEAVAKKKGATTKSTYTKGTYPPASSVQTTPAAAKAMPPPPKPCPPPPNVKYVAVKPPEKMTGFNLGLLGGISALGEGEKMVPEKRTSLSGPYSGTFGFNAGYVFELNGFCIGFDLTGMWAFGETYETTVKTSTDHTITTSTLPEDVVTIINDSGGIAIPPGITTLTGGGGSGITSTPGSGGGGALAGAIAGAGGSGVTIGSGLSVGSGFGSAVGSALQSIAGTGGHLIIPPGTSLEISGNLSSITGAVQKIMDVEIWKTGRSLSWQAGLLIGGAFKNAMTFFRTGYSYNKYTKSYVKTLTLTQTAAQTQVTGVQGTSHQQVPQGSVIRTESDTGQKDIVTSVHCLQLGLGTDWKVAKHIVVGVEGTYDIAISGTVEKEGRKTVLSARKTVNILGARLRLLVHF